MDTIPVPDRVKKKWRAPGRITGNDDDGLFLKTSTGLPPAAATRFVEVRVGMKTITSSRLQDPPKPVGASQSDCAWLQALLSQGINPAR